MRLPDVWVLVLAVQVALLPVARLAGAADLLVVGRAAPAQDGFCSVDIDVNPGLQPETVADVLHDNLQLTGGAAVESISVDNGVAHLDCRNARPESIVEFRLPDDVAAAIGASGYAVEGTVSRTALLVGFVAVIAGVAVGVCAAAGCFGDDDQPAVVRGTR